MIVNKYENIIIFTARKQHIFKTTGHLLCICVKTTYAVGLDFQSDNAQSSDGVVKKPLYSNGRINEREDFLKQFHNIIKNL